MEDYALTSIRALFNTFFLTLIQIAKLL